MKNTAVNKFKLLTIKDKKGKAFLKRRLPNFDFESASQKEINETVKLMRKNMEENDGAGLAANQIGLDWRLFIAKYKNKFYAVFNPEIVSCSKENSIMEEGCLSVPGIVGLVKRPEKIILTGQDKSGKKIKIKAWDILARIFQHEVDHLNGVLFIDKTKSLRKYENARTTENK